MKLKIFLPAIVLLALAMVPLTGAHNFSDDDYDTSSMKEGYEHEWRDPYVRYNGLGIYTTASADVKGKDTVVSTGVPGAYPVGRNVEASAYSYGSVWWTERDGEVPGIYEVKVKVTARATAGQQSPMDAKDPSMTMWASMTRTLKRIIIDGKPTVVTIHEFKRSDSLHKVASVNPSDVEEFSSEEIQPHAHSARAVAVAEIDGLPEERSRAVASK